jgi:hypothetical protein
LYSASYSNPDLAHAKDCFYNLLQTAINANFLLFSLATIRSYKSLQAELYLHALKLHITNKFFNFWFPILLIRGLAFTLLPLCQITGVKTTNIIALFGPIPRIVFKPAYPRLSCFFFQR